MPTSVVPTALWNGLVMSKAESRQEAMRGQVSETQGGLKKRVGWRLSGLWGCTAGQGFSLTCAVWTGSRAGEAGGEDTEWLRRVKLDAPAGCMALWYR